MRCTYPNPAQLPRNRRRLPHWIVMSGWAVLFVALSIALLGFTAYSV